MSSLRPWLVLICFAALTLPLMPLQQLFVWVSPRMARVFPMYYHRWSAHSRAQVEVTGEAPRKGPMLIVSNHVSWLDIVVLSAVAPVSFIAKRESVSWPFFGSLARLQRTIFVDRDRRHATGNSRDDMRERLRQGDMLVLFPEGTSNDGREVCPQEFLLWGSGIRGCTGAARLARLPRPPEPADDPAADALYMPGTATWTWRPIFSRRWRQGPSRWRSSAISRYPWGAS